MKQVSVILVWAATGQVCDENGKRVKAGNGIASTFDSMDLAVDYCNEVLLRLPFLECNIQSSDGTHLETRFNKTGWNHPYRIEPTGKYCVRLTEWFSRTNISETGEYLGADDGTPLKEFVTYSQAKRYCRIIGSRVDNVAPWIYGPDGVIMFCVFYEVTSDELGEELVYLPWWSSLWRKLTTVAFKTKQYRAETNSRFNQDTLG